MSHLLPEFARTGLAFVVVLGVLVFVHELGHYLAARWRGVHVEAFSIGFGRAIASWQDRHGTQWKVAWIPLGGYVKLHGQERPQDVSAEDRARWIPGQTFHDKPVLSRAIVVAAGPVANFVLAMVLFAGLFTIVGVPVIPPVVGGVVAASAAAHAGLQAGDRIVSIEGAPVRRFEDLQRLVAAHPDGSVSLTFTRDGQTRTAEATLGVQEADGQRIGLLGVRAAAPEYRRLDPLSASVAGVEQTWQVTAQTFVGITQMLTGQRGTGDLGGPLRIAQLSGEVAQLGVASLISFIAVLSVNLGLLNLFPIPVLDGGHLVFYLAEAIRGRPLPPRAQEFGFGAGLALLAGLFVFATWNDLSHLGVVRWVTALFS